MQVSPNGSVPHAGVRMRSAPYLAKFSGCAFCGHGSGRSHQIGSDKATGWDRAPREASSPIGVEGPHPSTAFIFSGS